MLDTGLLKIIAQPVTSVMLLATVTVALPSVSQAQRLSVTSTQANTNYTLGGGDRIRINVFEVPEYTADYQVPPGGAVNLPLIGSVSVLGLTTEQAADEISRRFARYLKRPLISVNLLSPRPINVVVAGEVTRPGAYSLSLQGGAGNDPGVQYPTVTSALTTAQGIALTGDETRVQVRRRIGRTGQEQTVTINVRDIRQTGSISQNITLRDGDSIYVPPAASLNLADVRNRASASYAADPTRPRTVVVTGEVYRPGSYLVTQGSADAGSGSNQTNAPTITGQPTVTRAVQLAGGVKPQANIRDIILRRPTKSGAEQQIRINLWDLLSKSDINQDQILQDGDTIYIPTATEVNRAEVTQLATTTLSPSRIQVSVIGEIKKPGQIEIQPNSSLNQALLAAGGFNDSRANRKAVDLIRLNPDGSVTKRIVKIDLKAGINEQTNPILLNNDVVLISRNGITKSSEGISTILNPLLSVFGIFRTLTTGY